MRLQKTETLQTTAQIVKPYDPATMPVAAQEPQNNLSFMPIVGLVAAVLIVSFISLRLFKSKRSRR